MGKPSLLMPALEAVKIVLMLESWIAAWNRHDLEDVLRPMDDSVVFEHWNAQVIHGKEALRRAWTAWFVEHGDFHFILTNYCVDEPRQRFVFEWRLHWPSREPGYLGQAETRHGVDIIQLTDGKITSKRTYLKTVVLLASGSSVSLTANAALQRRPSRS
jgi:hypothetical protein